MLDDGAARLILFSMTAFAAVPNRLKRGPITVAEALAEGINWRQLQGNMWRRIGPGQYAWSGMRDSPLLRLAAVFRRLSHGAAFSGRTAGWLHGLDLSPCDPIEVTVAEDVGISARSGVAVRRAALAADEIVERQGFPATSALRTVCDLASGLPLFDAVVAVDMALQKQLVGLTDVSSALASRSGCKGVVRLRRAVALADGGAQSPMETRFRLTLVLAGLPRPEAQVSLFDERGNFVGRPDLYYRSQRLALEYDGAVHRDSLVEDSRRQNLLVNAGYRLLRFTATDVIRTPDAVVTQVRKALSQA
jgi:Protein of unknown function (DUF559)